MIDLSTVSKFSDYIVYVDESGDHSLTSIDPEYPAFALAFCVFEKAHYVSDVVPAVQRFKFAFWGTDTVILHESDIRRSAGSFNILLNPTTRDRFYSALNSLITAAPFEIISAVIQKQNLTARYVKPHNPYEVALMFCLERLHQCLLELGQQGHVVHVVFESRGRNEDRSLELEFHRILTNGGWGYRKTDFSAIRYVPVVTKKDANSTGLQLADLTARPIALHSLRPTQPNRAYDLIAPKLSQPAKVFP